MVDFPMGEIHQGNLLGGILNILKFWFLGTVLLYHLCYLFYELSSVSRAIIFVLPISFDLFFFFVYLVLVHESTLFYSSLFLTLKFYVLIIAFEKVFILATLFYEFRVFFIIVFSSVWGNNENGKQRNLWDGSFFIKSHV